MRILELYKEMADDRQRFIDEIFEYEIYRPALPQLTIFDLGAYMGEFAFYTLNIADKIYCFEPDPYPYKKLKERVKKYGLEDKVIITNTALSDSRGKMAFHATHYGGSKIVGDAQKEYPDKEIITVPTMTLAQFMKKHKVKHIDILKVDIEDGEIAVFNSPDFKDVAYKIDLIIGEHLGGVDSLLKAYGFNSYPVEGNTIYKR